MRKKEWGPGTILARGGLPSGREAPPPARPGPLTPEPVPLAEPITLASVYRFRDLGQVNDVWDGRAPGYVYRRFGHPNEATLEKLVAALEGAEDALACSSGMGAVLAALLAHVRAGESVVAQEGLYGGTQTLLSGQLSRLEIGFELAAEPTPEAFGAAIQRLERRGGKVRLLLAETIANPSLKVADLPGLSRLARERGLVLLVDNTFATPLACRPLRWGPALVIHSLTKYLNGHSDVIGGVVAGPKDLVDPCRITARAAGLTIAPFDAWLTLRGLKTLHLRFERQQANAERVAGWLEGRPGVSRVLYPGLVSHPSHETARRVLDGFGAMVSFVLEGGDAAVERLLDRLELIAFSPSLGETCTTVSYPAITSHRALNPAEKEAAGAGLGLLRLSVGTEDVRDILADLERGLVGLTG